MSYNDLNERAVIAMTQRLQNDLNGNIDLINANTAATPSLPQYTIAYPQKILDRPPIPGELTVFPIVALADGPINYEDDVGWGATGIYEMTVLAYLSSPDPAALAWMLRRYAQAITTTAIKGRNVDGGAWGLIVKRIVPSPRLARLDPNTGAQSFMGFTAVTLTLKDEQDVP